MPSPPARLSSQSGTYNVLSRGVWPYKPVAPPGGGGTPVGPKAPLLFEKGPLLPAPLRTSTCSTEICQNIRQTEGQSAAEKGV